MNNLFQSDLPIHRTYDLKGSTLGRKSKQPISAKTILKDLDVDIAIRLEASWKAKFMAQLETDCWLLEQLRVMDYSLLLGIHFRSVADTPRSDSIAVARYCLLIILKDASMINQCRMHEHTTMTCDPPNEITSSSRMSSSALDA